MNSGSFTQEQANFHRQIILERPDLIKTEVEAIIMGQQGIVLRFGDEFFKKPKDSHTGKSHSSEIYILKELAGSNFPIPEVTFTGSDESFFATRRMPGLLLSQALHENKLGNDLTPLWTDIATFMHQIAGFFTAERVARIGLKQMFQPSTLVATQEALREPNFKKYMDNESHHRLKDLGERTLENAFWPYAPHITHGDMSPNNILVDPISGRLTGIIDFGRTGFHPFELDFTRFSVFGPEALQALIKIYENRTKKQISLKRVILLRIIRLLVGIHKKMRSNANEVEIQIEMNLLVDLLDYKWLKYVQD